MGLSWLVAHAAGGAPYRAPVDAKPVDTLAPASGACTVGARLSWAWLWLRASSPILFPSCFPSSPRPNEEPGRLLKEYRSRVGWLGHVNRTINVRLVHHQDWHTEILGTQK